MALNTPTMDMSDTPVLTEASEMSRRYLPVLLATWDEVPVAEGGDVSDWSASWPTGNALQNEHVGSWGNILEDALHEQGTTRQIRCSVVSSNASSLWQAALEALL